MTRPLADWPVPGPIDLDLHDPPHRSSTTEWWYMNGHFTAPDGRELSLFAAFFRIVKGRNEQTRALEYAHSCTWAISDGGGHAYHSESRVDASAPRMGLERIKRGQGSRDPRLNRAMTEVLERGRIPAPDRAFDGEVFVAPRGLHLDYAGARFDKLDDGSYRLQLSCRRTGAGCDVTFHPEKEAIRHGDDGLVKGHGGEDMFYYFIPRCRLSGVVTVAGAPMPIAKGQGWYDHEFGGPSGEPKGEERAQVEIAWNWIAAQLDDGHEITAYELVRADDSSPLYRWAILIGPDGKRTQCSRMELTPGDTWRSTRTFYDYPITWSLAVPEAKLSLSVQAAFADQEFITCISKPAFWEGRCKVSGTIAGKPVSGLAYVERSGFQPVRTLDEFFTAVGEEVRASVARLLPEEPTHAEARELIACDEREQYMEGVDRNQLARALWKPIREMTDRGGKSWRSYAALACCDVVDGDSRNFVQWLAVPELLHVGSLIIDDIEDRSTLRRGGPACHLVHGEPIAINAGTAAYFLAQRLLITAEVSNADKLRLYDLYFEAMRAGHAGQAIDLDGMAGLMPEVVRTGDASALEQRILAIHRLKTAAPAAALARMGAVAGGGSRAQVEAVGGFFEALGLAFQIVDDVLNLRGFKNNLKNRGEDISNGTVTLPIAKAMGRLPENERRALWKTLESKPTDLTIVSATVEKLETCGAIEACAVEARERVEVAWQKAEPLLPDSLPKVMLRAFGWYVLERHY